MSHLVRRATAQGHCMQGVPKIEQLGLAIQLVLAPQREDAVRIALRMGRMRGRMRRMRRLIDACGWHG